MSWKARLSILYLQLNFDEIKNDFLTETRRILEGVELKKKKKKIKPSLILDFPPPKKIF